MHKPVESDNKQPRALQGAPFLGVPRIDRFPVICPNTLRGARAVHAFPLMADEGIPPSALLGALMADGGITQSVFFRSILVNCLCDEWDT